MNLSGSSITPGSQPSFFFGAAQQNDTSQGNAAYVSPSITENKQFNHPRHASAEQRIRTQLPVSLGVSDAYYPFIKENFPHLSNDVLHDRHVTFYTMRKIMLNHGLRPDSPFLNNEYIDKFFFPALQVIEMSPQQYYYAPHDKTFLSLVGEDFLTERLGPLLGSPLPSTVPATSRQAYLQLYCALEQEMQTEQFANKYVALRECIQFLEQRLCKIAIEHSPSSQSDYSPFSGL